jgi:hypothetical protein
MYNRAAEKARMLDAKEKDLFNEFKIKTKGYVRICFLRNYGECRNDGRETKAKNEQKRRKNDTISVKNQVKINRSKNQ